MNKEIEYNRWFKNGDHPQDKVGKRNKDGKIVGRYKTDDCLGMASCDKCGHSMEDHGCIKNYNSKGIIVCPGDYIVREGFNFIPIESTKIKEYIKSQKERIIK